ncbi:WD40 repeat domain-containing serine/threonine-protein kinase [Actinomadura fibrosa]|uniref:Protein kinase n=1 Tax=Actinomadura fibrosa TaxID=111802 RepID=A0ABW2XE38_9ACTN|nr:WD40 repeat domain-containing serine/threonine-protein kinase [Actinomadura fibrosa]
MAEPLLEGDPRQLGGYWLAARLGAGGQGVVYEGYDARGGRVAVKALHADAVDAAVRDAMRREVATLQRVASFCTARIITADLDHQPPYIVSEYVPGPDLHGWVTRNGAYGPGELYRLAIGVATALSSIHRAGVVHRDLKPANVLLGPDGPRVIDFGIARTDEMSRSATGLKGTPRWMAPEMFRGQRPTPAVDVWAWGAIVLFAATGKPPFDGGSLPSLMHQITTVRPDTGVLGEPLRGFVEAALDQDPALRPAPEEILIGLVGGAPSDPLEAGRRAAAESARPSMALPPSLAEIAERVHAGLDPHAQQAVPRILLRMVVARPDASGALCTVPIGDFADGETDHDTVRRVLRAFGEAGIVRDAGGGVTIATPALLRAWPRMRDWVAAERDGLDGHHALAGAARRWNAGGRKPADLLQGTSLDEALGWASAGRRQLTLNLAERAFLAASVEQTRRRARTRTVVTAALAALLLVAVIAGGAAGVQSWNLGRANATVSAQRDAAVGRQLAAQAVQIRRTDPTLARRLAVAAASLAGDVPDTHNALLSVSSQWEQDIWRPPGTDGTWNDVYPSGGGPNVFWKRGQNTVVIADAGARRVVRTIRVPGAPPAGMDLTLDGNRLLTLQTDGTLTFWDVAKGTARPLPFKHEAGAGLWLGPTGARLVKTKNGRIRVLESATGREMFSAKGRSVGNPAMSPDERYLVMPLKKGKAGARLAWWDLSTGKEVDGRHNAPNQYPFAGARQFLGTTFSPDGRFLATRAGGDVIAVLDARTREIRTTLSVPKGTDETRLDFSRDGRFIATDTTMWSTETGTDEAPVLRYTPDASCYGTSFDRDGTSLRCVDDQDRIRSIDVSGFTRILRFSELSVQSAISRDGTTLAVRAVPDAVQIWDTATGTKRTDLAIGHPVETEIALSPDGRMLALPAKDGTVEIWDVRARTRRTVINAGPPPLAGRPLPSFSPDGKAVAVLTSTSPSVLKFWDAATGRPLGTAQGRRTIPTVSASDIRIVWSGDGRRVVSATDLGVVEFPSGRTLVGPGAFGAPVTSRTVQALSPQGVLATVEGVVDQSSLIFWDARTLKQTGGPVRLPASKTPITAISPDGRLAATADLKGKIDIWDVRTQRHLGLALTGHTTNYDTVIQSLAFSPDGSRVYSVGQDDAKLVTHIVAPGLLKDALCKKTGQLTPQEWKQYVGKDNGIGYQRTCRS